MWKTPEWFKGETKPAAPEVPDLSPELKKLEARIEALESFCDGLNGDWANAKQQLQRLYGRLTKQIALDNKKPEEQLPSTVDDVYRVARKQGLTR